MYKQIISAVEQAIANKENQVEFCYPISDVDTSKQIVFKAKLAQSSYDKHYRLYLGVVQREIKPSFLQTETAILHDNTSHIVSQKVRKSTKALKDALLVIQDNEKTVKNSIEKVFKQNQKNFGDYEYQHLLG